ncbi:MAG: DUF2183 domain-containing protein [Acidobacteriota bacterium]|nr:DUF2183 domain-containing protein [Acidobacteriota bacterium]
MIAARRFARSLILALSLTPCVVPQDQPGREAPSPAQEVRERIVVSDIDDTIKWSDILNRGHTFLRSALSAKTAFKGMPELYTALAKGGVSFAYVTGSPDLILPYLDKHALPQRIVKKNRFPAGPISMRPLPSGTEEFKVKTIDRIIAAHADASFILIGDNGERDPVTYHRLRSNQALKTRIRDVYIHRLYNGGRSADLYPGQRPYLTAAELAAMLYGSGWLDEKDLHSILQIVSKNFKSDKRSDRDLALPYAAELRAAQIADIYRSLPPMQDPQDKVLLDEIHQMIRNRLTD